MTKKCCVCGCEFVPRQRNYVTCGDPDCRRIQHLEYMSAYGKKHRKEHREYNRAWMQRKRMEQKTEDEEKRIRRGICRETDAEDIGTCRKDSALGGATAKIQGEDL